MFITTGKHAIIREFSPRQPVFAQLCVTSTSKFYKVFLFDTEIAVLDKTGVRLNVPHLPIQVSMEDHVPTRSRQRAVVWLDAAVYPASHVTTTNPLSPATLCRPMLGKYRSDACAMPSAREGHVTPVSEPERTHTKTPHGRSRHQYLQGADHMLVNHS